MTMHRARVRSAHARVRGTCTKIRKLKTINMSMQAKQVCIALNGQHTSLLQCQNTATATATTAARSASSAAEKTACCACALHM